MHFESSNISDSLREKRPNTEVFLIGIFLYSVRVQENTDQKELRIWALFTQCKDFPEMTGRYLCGGDVCG